MEGNWKFSLLAIILLVTSVLLMTTAGLTTVDNDDDDADFQRATPYQTPWPYETPYETKYRDTKAKGGITFTVHGVNKSDSQLPVGLTPAEIVSKRCGVQPEAYSSFNHTPFEKSDYRPLSSPLSNAFIIAVETAFAHHYPLVFTPDAIWLCIMQGLSAHINNNAEKLRHYFVEFEGKKTIEIWPSSPFIKGSSLNPWPEVLELFSDGIKTYIGDKTHRLLTPEFSTTGPIERAAAQIVLMDSFKQYFDYVMVLCGIPFITLEGTVEDWKLLRERALALRQYELDWWIDELEPVLDQFVSAASGNVDKEFWVRIYKLERAYDFENINGWILTLFPYITGPYDIIEKRNTHLGAWKIDEYIDSVAVTTTSAMPSGLVSVPFTWITPFDVYNMSFFAGFMAATQNPDTLAIYPEIGWAVTDRVEPKLKAA